ncbi:hypothetical protein [Bacillus velezensis]|uniref:hypothetical protein n=1 Tax=Bacillus velezensis TaxID=492670 RepID=UPI002417CE6D|nr:hypothetical protein [Bacillus velezensis]WFP05539.1 hypothetical protein JEQ22_20015 [Bacillus velezensis]
MKEVSHNEWMDTVKKLNVGQPDLTDLINQQIESYENEMNALNKNTWGIGLYELNEKDEFNKLLGLNLGTEQKAREVFDRIQIEFSKNTVNPDAIIDLVDEDYNVIEHYPLTKKQIVTVASLLGHDIKLGVTEMENPRSREGRIKFILKKLGTDNAPLKYLATLNDRQLKAYFDKSYPDLKDKEDYISPRYSPRGHSLEKKRLDRNTPVNKGIIKLNAKQLIDALQSMIDQGEIKEEAKVLLNTYDDYMYEVRGAEPLGEFVQIEAEIK